MSEACSTACITAERNGLMVRNPPAGWGGGDVWCGGTWFLAQKCQLATLGSWLGYVSEAASPSDVMYSSPPPYICGLPGGVVVLVYVVIIIWALLSVVNVYEGIHTAMPYTDPHHHHHHDSQTRQSDHKCQPPWQTDSCWHFPPRGCHSNETGHSNQTAFLITSSFSNPE